MAAASRYLLSVVAAAILVGVLTGIMDKKGSSGTLIRLIGALFMTFTIIQPFTNFDWSYLTAFAEEFSADGEAAAAQGEILADEEYRSIIKSQVEAYILDKAESYQAELSVEVTLSTDDPPVPATVRLQGAVSPYAKNALQKMMEEELGIREEDQLWIG